jgi:hypothetical protein
MLHQHLISITISDSYSASLLLDFIAFSSTSVLLKSDSPTILLTHNMLICCLGEMSFHFPVFSLSLIFPTCPLLFKHNWKPHSQWLHDSNTGFWNFFHTHWICIKICLFTKLSILRSCTFYLCISLFWNNSWLVVHV